MCCLLYGCCICLSWLLLLLLVVLLLFVLVGCLRFDVLLYALLYFSFVVAVVAAGGVAFVCARWLFAFLMCCFIVLYLSFVVTVVAARARWLFAF